MSTSVNGVPIDNKTGLPQLPKGYFWEVENVDPINTQRGIFRRVYIYVKLMREAWVRGHYAYDRPWYYFGFKRKQWIEGHLVDVVVKRHAVVLHEVSPNVDEAIMFSYADYLTKEGLFGITINMYKLWQKSYAEQETTKALIGKYPPKKVEV